MRSYRIYFRMVVLGVEIARAVMLTANSSHQAGQKFREQFPGFEPEKIESVPSQP